MTRSQGLALTVALLAIAAGTGAGVWWLHATHEAPAQVDASATVTPPGPAPAAPDHPAAAAPPTGQAAAPKPAELASREMAPTPPDGVTPQASPSPSAPLVPTPSANAGEAGDKPSFDIVRVEPRGDTVVAGKGAPNAKVMLMAGGRKVGEAATDANGQFVILPPPLAPGDYALTLHQERPGAAADESAQSVAVSVPKPGKGSVVVALAEPGKATKLLSAPPEAPPSPAAPATPAPVSPAPGKVVIRSAELENGSGFFVSGSATPGTPVHVYLNDAHIADVVAGRDGGWSVRVKKGLTGGHYVVRADAGDTGRAVSSRAEVPFDVPEAMAEATPSPPAAQTPAAASPPVATPTPSAATTPAPAPGPVEARAAAKPQQVEPTPPAEKAPAAAAVPPAAPPQAAAPTVASAAPADSGADATIESLATARVIRGDNLWNISRFRLGDGKRYTQIYAANADQIRDPDLIYPGQVFVVPKR